MIENAYTQRLLEPSEVYSLICEHREDDTDFLPVFVGGPESFMHARIPGSQLITPAQLACGVAPAAGKIADQDDLVYLFQELGISSDTTIIAYDDEGGGWAGRLIWTLDVIGHENYLILNGGIHAWAADGLDVATGVADTDTRGRSDYQFAFDAAQIVNYQSIIEKLNTHSVRIWDARSAEEHSGEKVQAARGGRIPGAKNIDWLALMDRSNALRLKPWGDLEQLLERAGLSANDTTPVITHCQSHHRSGLTYIVGKMMGLDIKAYDGSWSEWGNLPDTPVETDQ